MFLKVLLHTISSCLDLLQNYETVTTTNKTENITDVSESITLYLAV